MMTSYVGSVAKKLSQKFSRRKSRILGALSRLNEFFLNPLIQGHSGTTPETSRITLGTNQGTNEDDCHCDPHPEASVSQSQNTQSSGPNDECDRFLFDLKNALDKNIISCDVDEKKTNEVFSTLSANADKFSRPIFVKFKEW